MIQENQLRLRLAANRVIAAVNGDEAKAKDMLGIVNSLIQSVQKSITQIKAAPTFAIMASENYTDEKRRIASRLSGFDSKESPVWQEITKRFGNNIKQGDLMNIAQVIAEKAQIKLDRDAKRRKAVLLRWFDENWEKVRPLLDFVVFEETKDDDRAESPEM